MLNTIDQFGSWIAVPGIFLAIGLTWGKGRYSIWRLQAAFRLYLAVLLLDLLRFGINVFQAPEEGWSGAIVLGVIVLGVAYLMARTGRDADLAEKRAMAKLTGDA
jgi:hypothetical protein